MYKIMESTICWEKDLATGDEAVDRAREYLYGMPGHDLPFNFDIVDQSSLEVVATISGDLVIEEVRK